MTMLSVNFRARSLIIVSKYCCSVINSRVDFSTSSTNNSWLCRIHFFFKLYTLMNEIVRHFFISFFEASIFFFLFFCRFDSFFDQHLSYWSFRIHFKKTRRHAVVTVDAFLIVRESIIYTCDMKSCRLKMKIHKVICNEFVRRCSFDCDWSNRWQIILYRLLILSWLSVAKIE